MSKVKSPKKRKNGDEKLSFKELFKFYTKVKMPWWLIFLNLLMSIVLKELQARFVPYQSKIMTGAIEEGGFLVGFIVMTIACALAEAVQGGIGDIASLRSARNVRHTVWNKLLNLKMKFFRKSEPQRLVSRVTQDTTGAYAAINCLVQIISVGYGIYTSFDKMYKTYHELALIMLTSIPITIFSTWVVGKMQYKIDYIINNSYSKITNFFGERLPNILHIKTANNEDEEYKKGVQASEERYKAEVKQEKIFIFQMPLTSFAQMINQIVLLLVASEMVRQGTMKMYHLVNMYNYYLLFMGNAIMISGIWQGIKKSHGSCAVIAKIANDKGEDLVSGDEVEKNGQDISFNHVSFSYDGENKVLEDVNFTIPYGKVTCIVGENGSGKSTVIKLLERFEETDSGEIFLGDKNIRDVNLHSWRDSVSYIMQSGQAIKGSIRENIAYGTDREFTEEELIAAAKSAQAYDFIVSREDGFDTQIGSFDSKCSGGELQRIAIARALLKKPEYLIMDEATCGIDIVSEAAVWEGIKDAMKDKTIIVVSHDMGFIRKADNIVVLNDGKVEASGSFDKVSRESSLFSDFLAVTA